MIKSVWMPVLLIAVVIIFVAGPVSTAQAQDNKSTEVKSKESEQESLTISKTVTVTDNAEDFMDKSKKPAPWITWGFDQRCREVYFNNILLMNKERPGHESHFQRWRSRLWSTITPFDNVEINSRLVWEFRTYEKPDEPRGGGRTSWHSFPPIHPQAGTNSDVIFDRLNITFKKLFDLPLKVVIGRQDIILGNGWLVLDGTPWDGSRSIYFDAIRFTYDRKDIKTKFDLIYIDQPADADSHINPFNDQDTHMQEQDERGVILYVTNKSLSKTQIDGYYIYKHNGTVTAHNEFGVDTLIPGTQSANIHTFGARVVHNFNDNWRLRAEFAEQLGHKNECDLAAFGFNSRLTYFFKDKYDNQLRIGYEYLSGDDPGTDTDEQFDPLWARWPQFSELYVYTYAPETRIAETTNLHRIGMGWSCKPNKKIEVRTDYHLLWADENTLGGTRHFSRSGDFRGQLVTALMKYKFNKHISGHLVGEFFFPGNYYTDDANDAAALLRYELVFTW